MTYPDDRAMAQLDRPRNRGHNMTDMSTLLLLSFLTVFRVIRFGVLILHSFQAPIAPVRLLFRVETHPDGDPKSKFVTDQVSLHPSLLLLEILLALKYFLKIVRRET